MQKNQFFILVEAVLILEKKPLNLVTEFIEKLEVPATMTLMGLGVISSL